MRTILSVGLLGGLWAGGVSAQPAEVRGAASPPNVVLILIDDMGWSDLGCYGNAFHETPRIDALAAQGMRFTDAYASCPVCSPTRAALQSGKNPARLGLTDFIPGHWRPWARLVVPPNAPALPPGEVTFAQALQQAGYATGCFGKWHLGHAEDQLPGARGYDDWTVSFGHYGIRTIPGQPPLGSPAPDQYASDYLTDLSVEFIDKHREQPFCLFLSHYAVHVPLLAPQDLIHKYANKTPPEHGVNNAVYAAMVESVDRSVGRVLDTLDRNGLADNTMVIVTSDNGGLYRRYDSAGPAVMDNAPLRGEKGTLYEGGIRVPLIVRWPGRVVPGQTAVPAITHDLYPTMLAAAGAAVPEGQTLDGIDLTPLLTGGDAPAADRPLHWHYPHYHHTRPAAAIRRGPHKLIHYFEDGRDELYDLAADLGETNDLSGERPELTAELATQLRDWQRSVGAKMPTANPEADTDREELWRPRPR